MPEPAVKTPDEGLPEAVRTAWGLEHGAARISVGWINRTFCARRGAERVVVQRLHPVFDASVNLDIDAITRHLEARGVKTPRLVPTLDGRPFLEHDGVWRALSHLPGETLDALDRPELARSAGALAARFHRALADLDHVFTFTRPGAHDTRAHLDKLRRLRAAHPEFEPIGALADELLVEGDALAIPEGLPVRIIHGDLKATNLLFEAGAATAIVDLDTLQHGTIDIELGDALRSWCNRSFESDPDATFDAELFGAAVEGYASGASGLLVPVEIDAIVGGAERICLELAARFAADVYEDRYFGWDATRYGSRVEHNLARVRAQGGLARSVAAQRPALEARVRAAFAS